MTGSVRPLVAAAIACVAVTAQALGATVKREVPLLFPGVYLKNTPIQAYPGLTDFDSIAFDGLQIWVASRGVGLVKRYDAVSNTLKGTISVPGARKLVFDGTTVWVFTRTGKGYQYGLDGVRTGQTITFPGAPAVSGAAFDGDSVWVSTDDGNLYRLDVATRALRAFPIGSTGGSVAFEGKDLWVNFILGGLTKVSGATGQVLWHDPAIGGATSTNGVAFDGQYIWAISGMEADKIWKIDPATNQVVATVSGYPGVHAIAFDGTRMWVVCTYADAIIKIDTRTSQIVGTIQLPAESWLYDLAFDGTHMWVAAEGRGLIYKFLARY